MFPVAHSAVGAILGRRFEASDGSTGRAAAAGIAAALVPDLIDKPLAWVLHWTPTSHHIAHSLPGALAAAGVVHVAFGRTASTAFGASYLAHLVTDEIHHGKVPWLMPFSRRRRVPSFPPRAVRIVGGLMLEVVGLLYFLREARAGQRPAVNRP